MGNIGILNVGAGDTKLSFDKSNPSECIRSARIVTDMLRRGYALLIEVPDGKGGITHERVRSFREDTCEYIIADLDPVTAAVADETEHAQAEQVSEATPETARYPAPEPQKITRSKPKLKTKNVAASSATGIAVARSAGG